ncbi:hypothetical protein ACQKWADRAFT_280651 [Trichoderma austrokoningii]
MWQLLVHRMPLFVINTVGDMPVFQTLGFDITEAGCFWIVTKDLPVHRYRYTYLG